MSNLSMTPAEEKALDKHLEEKVMTWVTTRQAEAEQLAMDSARLMACTTDRLDKLKNQGFFKRCWSRLSGQAGAMERANVNDMIQMQKMAFRYVNMLQEQQLLMAHSLLSLKNNLNSLAIREEQTRQMIGLLAERTRERFEKLEKRVAKVEVNQNLQGWLLGLEEREYNRLYPTEYMRLFRVINDFYAIKNDHWDFNDLMLMRKAIRTVGLDPKWKLSIGLFLNSLTDEIQRLNNGHDDYREAITEHAPSTIANYSQFAIENISSPAFLTLHAINTHYADKMEAIEALQDSLSISREEAMKTLLRQTIKNMNINLDYEFPLAETTIEILGCMRLSKGLEDAIQVDSQHQESDGYNISGTNGKECHYRTNAESPLDLFTRIVNQLQKVDEDELIKSSFRFTQGKSFGIFPSNVTNLMNKLNIDPTTNEYIILSDGNIGIITLNKSYGEIDLIPFDLNNKLFAKLDGEETLGKIDEDSYSTKTSAESKYFHLFERTLARLEEKSDKEKTTRNPITPIDPTAAIMGAALGGIGIFGAFLGSMYKDKDNS